MRPALTEFLRTGDCESHSLQLVGIQLPGPTPGTYGPEGRGNRSPVTVLEEHGYSSGAGGALL